LELRNWEYPKNSGTGLRAWKSDKDDRLNDRRNESKNREERNTSAVTKVKQNRWCRKSPSSNRKVLKQQIGREAEDLKEIEEFQTESVSER